MSALVSRDLTIVQGASNSSQNTWAFRFLRKNDAGVAVAVDLSLWTAHAQFRSTIGGNVWRDFTETDGISLSSTGDIAITIEAEETETPPWNARKVGVWDLQITSPDGHEVLRFAEGNITVSAGVTRG